MQILSSWYIVSSIIFLWHYVGFMGVLLALIQPCVDRLLISFGSKILAWIVHLAIISIIYYEKTYGFVFENWLGIEEEKYYMLTIALCWIQLRSISSCLDCITHDEEPKTLAGFVRSFLKTTAYCLYLPTLFLGPVILYKDFLDGVSNFFLNV